MRTGTANLNSNRQATYPDDQEQRDDDAMSALFRICLEKLAETFFTPTEVAANFVFRASCRLFCVWLRERLGPQLELLVAPVLAAPRPWMTALPRPSDAASLRTS